MAALEKQIQASEKRIAKFEKNIQMYDSRMNKKLELLQEQGYIATREDFRIQKTGRWKYDYDITVSEQVKQQVPFQLYMPVVENLQYKQENTDRLADEKENLKKLIEKDNTRTQTDSEISEQNKLLAKHLGEALTPFKIHWMEDMTNYHREFYHRIHKALPNARVQYDELQKAIYDEKRKNCFRPSARIKQMEEARRAFGRILSAPPAAYPTEENYMDYIKSRLEEDYNNCLYVLADKCRPFQLDAGKVQVHHPRMAERGFDLLLTDGKERVIDARMIWAAENSEYVSPHTRYIVTERTVKEQETRPKTIQERITDITFPYGDRSGRHFIRCKIDGEQQLSVRMSFHDSLMWKHGNVKPVDLAMKYYRNILDEGQNQSQSQGRKF